jgi:hypothetical protein
MTFSLTSINDEEIYLVMASAAEIRNKNIELIKTLMPWITPFWSSRPTSLMMY